MNWARWERLAYLDGIIAVVLWIVGIWILEGPGDEPDTGSAAAIALDFFKTEESAILAGTFVYMIGTLFFLWFLGALRAALHTAEGGVGRVATTAASGGLAFGICMLLMPAGTAAGALRSDNLEAATAQTLLTLVDVFAYAGELAVAVLLLGTAIVILQTRVLPRWLGWGSALIALWLLIPPVGWAALIFAFPLWLIVVGLLLYRQAGATTPGAAAVP